MAHLEENMRAVLASLEECQTSLILNGDTDTAQLLSVAILELKVKLNQIEDSELKALCDAMLRGEKTTLRSMHTKPPQGFLPRAQVALRLVK
ncbi:MAG TPA: hypothetical protein VKT76_15380 [Bradyrhizobium sp.]|nr:hypothetical protein [Bradyrhizobium sp.]